MIVRKVYAEVPPRVEYCLSEIGESLRPVIDTLKAWGESHQERLSCAAATIAGVPKAPSRYNPIVNPHLAQARRTYVLRRGFLDGREGFLLAVANAEGAYYRYQKAWLARQRRG